MFKPQFLLLLVSLFILKGCITSSADFRAYKNLKSGWALTDTISFELADANLDTLGAANFYIHLRNTDAYKYSNIFLIASLKQGDQLILSDTLEYAMAAPNGEWLGKGFSGLKESKLWWKEAYRFPSNGNFTVNITQTMRKSQAVDGIQNLDGIASVGFGLEYSQ